MNSLYAAVFILCTFIVTVLFICCKLIRQDSRIEAIYQPQVLRPPRSVAKLRKKPRSKSNPSRAIGTQTLNVNVFYAAFKKESVPSKPTISESLTSQVLKKKSLNWRLWNSSLTQSIFMPTHPSHTKQSRTSTGQVLSTPVFPTRFL